MTRCAYLLSNNDGLPGVKKDIEDFRLHLLSDAGGAWRSDEILCRYNIRLSQLKSDLSNIRFKCFDYVVFYYSGHGDWKRETRLYINEQNEFVGENEISGLSTRQLSIFDCCRVNLSLANESRTIVFDAVDKRGDYQRAYARSQFDRLTIAAPRQELKLYACRYNECAIAAGTGSLYTQALLSSANSLSRFKDVDVVKAHDVSCAPVSARAAQSGKVQRPDRNPVGFVLHPFPFAIKLPNVMFG